MYLLFTENHTAEVKPAIGDGSYLALTKCEEGWFALDQHQAIIDSLGWEYTEVESITPIQADIL